MNSHSSDTHGAPVLWLALILLAACIAGTLAVVTISAVKGADELPAVYHSEGSAADGDLAALAQAATRHLNATLHVRGQEVKVQLLADQEAISAGEPLTLRLTHATRSGLDQTVLLRQEGDGRLAGAISAPLAAGSWLAEIRPASMAWLLRGRIGVAGGRIKTGPP